MSIFEDYVLAPMQYGLNKPKDLWTLPPNIPKINRYCGNIEKGTLNIIGGRPTSGKTSYMDYTYFLSTLINWYSKPEGDRPKLKIFYFNLRRNPKVKLQKWVCTYIKLVYDIVIDPATIISGLSAFTTLDEELQVKIQEAVEFFKVVEESVLTFVNSRNCTPTDILTRVSQYMEENGVYDKHANTFTPYPEHMDETVMVFIDNMDVIAEEYDGGAKISGEYLKKRVQDVLVTLKSVFNTTVFLCLPTKSQSYLRVSDGEPSYRDIGSFKDIADLAIVLYNPYNERNYKYGNYNVEQFVVKGKTRMRTATIVANNNGVENVTFSFIFLGESGYFREMPDAIDEEVLTQLVENLRRLG